MKILFTQWGLSEKWGGSELFLVEVAAELARRGHEIAVYAGTVGKIGREFQERTGIPVMGDPRHCPWTPDIIHGQNRIHALKGLMAFPGTPAILYLHGFLPVLEKPFLHPRIHCYVAISQGIANRWIKGLGIPREKFEIIPNHIDLVRFQQIRKPPEHPQRALLYSNGRFTEGQISKIRKACEARGIAMEMAGSCVGRQIAEPEKLLPDYDLVFAVGRSALEAIASGCGVIPVFGDMAEEMVLPENMGRLREQNMSVRVLVHQKLTEEWITSQIAAWNPQGIATVTQWIREETPLSKTVDRLEGIYNSAISESREKPPVDLEIEIKAIHVMIQKEEAYGAAKQRRMLTNRIKDMESSWSWKVMAPFRWIQRAVLSVHNLN